jgi:uncharacterized membrane protein YhiD involved in acid resistance
MCLYPYFHHLISYFSRPLADKEIIQQKGSSKMKNKKIALGVTAALFLGSTVGFAAGVGFFDNATTVEQNIYKLANIATQNKQKAADVQSKLDQTTGQQKNLQDQLDNLKQQLANKQNEVKMNGEKRILEAKLTK